MKIYSDFSETRNTAIELLELKETLFFNKLDFLYSSITRHFDHVNFRRKVETEL